MTRLSIRQTLYFQKSSCQCQNSHKPSNLSIYLSIDISTFNLNQGSCNNWSLSSSDYSKPETRITGEIKEDNNQTQFTRGCNESPETKLPKKEANGSCRRLCMPEIRKGKQEKRLTRRLMPVTLQKETDIAALERASSPK
ncbi:hypothetical protein OIU79_006660 [Salix purpurea]|uniref:Uncharacterized protein n=1 Tax=Salix purpurea TaxID=77065 RepID=A0A9Q0TW02_SALPP|nr:hypothetical protein OIU79_006660 [Salix purpurea]